MQYAIDLYAKGGPKEVEAWSGQTIPASYQRFRCPVCMEYVALSKAGFFRHKVKNAATIECENRVDSNSRSEYEKAGLPFYLESVGQGLFRLCIGLPGVPGNLLDEAYRERARLKISNGTKEVEYFISPERFYPDNRTFLPVNFRPINNNLIYFIRLSGCPAELYLHWHYISDTWGEVQFFKVGEHYSRKVKLEGTVVTDQDYYFIGDSDCFKSYKSIVDISMYGILKLEGLDFPVYKLRIYGDKTNDPCYSRLVTTLSIKFGVNLRSNESGLLPLWPPCLDNDNELLYGGNTDLAFFYVNSTKAFPVVYKYSKDKYEPIYPVVQAPKLLELKPTKNGISLSVDSAFGGNIQYIRMQEYRPVSGSFQVDILDENGVSILQQPPETLKDRAFTVRASAKCKVLRLAAQGYSVAYDCLGEEGVTLTNLKWGDTLLVVTTAWAPVLELVLAPPYTKAAGKQANIDITRYQVGPTKKVDARTLLLYKQLASSPALAKAVGKYVRSGKIPRLLENYLWSRIREI